MPRLQLAGQTRRPLPASIRNVDRVDPSSRRWLAHLRPGHPDHDRAVTALHDVLHRAAVSELSRRRHRLWSISGPEFDDLALQAANDAVVAVLAKLDEFRGHSRFTTWAYSFVALEVSSKVARHRWRREPPARTEPDYEALRDPAAPQPEARLDRLTQLAALARAIGELTPRQRETFVAVALNEIPIDAVALRLRSNRNAVYKALFDARRNLRRSLEAAGLPLRDAERAKIAASGNARTAPARACSAADAVALRDRR